MTLSPEQTAQGREALEHCNKVLCGDQRSDVEKCNDQIIAAITILDAQADHIVDVNKKVQDGGAAGDWVLVPKNDPTEEMMLAGDNAFKKRPISTWRDIYRAMIAARPRPNDKAQAQLKNCDNYNCQALRHLRDVLYSICDMHPDYRCHTIDDAKAFYNATAPEAIVGPSDFGYWRPVRDNDKAENVQDVQNALHAADALADAIDYQGYLKNEGSHTDAYYAYRAARQQMKDAP